MNFAQVKDKVRRLTYLRHVKAMQSMYQLNVGAYYMLRNGRAVHIVARAYNLQGYETVCDEHGRFYYDRSFRGLCEGDTGRLTGTKWENDSNLEFPPREITHKEYNKLKVPSRGEIKLMLEHGVDL